jgi:hypothetical protein
MKKKLLAAAIALSAAAVVYVLALPRKKPRVDD